MEIGGLDQSRGWTNRSEPITSGRRRVFRSNSSGGAEQVSFEVTVGTGIAIGSTTGVGRCLETFLARRWANVDIPSA